MAVTIQRLFQEFMALFLYLWMCHCFCSTLLFSTNFSAKYPKSWLARYLFPYSVDSYSAIQSDDVPNRITFNNLLINFILMAIFSFQHSAMAHGPIRRSIQKFGGKVGERAAYIGLSWVALHSLYVFWRPISRWETTLYHLPPIIGKFVDFMFICGIGATCLCICEAWFYDQFSIRTAFTGIHYCQHPKEHLTAFHKFVRQPVFGAQIFGLLMAKQMSFGRFLFVSLMVVYTYIGVVHHEKGIEKDQGTEIWQLYKQTTSTFFPLKRYLWAMLRGKEDVRRWNEQRNELYRRQYCTENGKKQ